MAVNARWHAGVLAVLGVLFLPGLAGATEVDAVDAEAMPGAVDPTPPASAVRATDEGETFELEDARVFRSFEVYALGDSPLGLPLASVTGGEEEVGFTYGACDDAHSCMPPLQVVTYDACVRDLHYSGIDADERLRVRGVPAAFFERHGRLELATGSSTVVVYGYELGRERLLRAAGLLRGINVDVGADDPLPSRRDARCG
ncbi:MAG: hypothetical protein ICV64_07025 [Thermoleophilia bacterium]|nr:hypothetical protein [Thermoleophilia bacterium]